jgi:RNA polymerase sigma-70 factor (ECF subfamily)
VDYLRVFYRYGRDEVGGLEQDGRVEAFDDAILAEISIDRMLAQISSAQADAIRLVKIQGYSIAEASRATGQSEALIKVNIHRGLKHLAHHVESV